MRRNFLLLTLFVFLPAFSGCEKSAPETMPKPASSATTTRSAAPAQASTATPVPTASVPKDGDYPGRGAVTKINDELGSVEVDHGEIKDLMPPMRMEFYVKDKALLKGLAVGDRVDFVIAYKQGAEIITSIKKIQ